jgi:hypothetical protein
MKLPMITLASILIFLQVNVATAAEDRTAKQQELNKACEMAREKELIPMRKQLVEECMGEKERQKNDMQDCERLFGNYNGQRQGGLGPLFYDLPECEAATKYQKSYRQAD